MSIQQIILKKQKGKALTGDEIKLLINGYVASKIPDYQMAAFLMAVYFQGMNYEEIYVLTREMIESGEKMSTDSIPGIKVDKHSTGGVGDKVSIVLAPLVAAAGVIVPMISGRALCHSGGTLDKLESIPGFKTNLSIQQSLKLLSKIGVVLVGQTDKLVPADKKIYALRDSTATVESIPLITASILSKKLVEGINALVIDLKVGKGAFFKKYEYALKLADSLISTSEKFDLKTTVLFTAMEQPLGKAIGNWLEIKEVIATLKGEGPEDLLTVTLALGAEMMIRAKIEKNVSDAINRLKIILESGAAYRKFLEIVKNQGGKIKYIENPDLYEKSKYHFTITSERSGYIKEIDALEMGILSMELGAGRKTINDKINHRAGLILNKKVGEFVNRNEPIVEIFTDINFSNVVLNDRISNAIKIAGGKVEKPNPILGYATNEGIFKWPY